MSTNRSRTKSKQPKNAGKTREPDELDVLPNPAGAVEDAEVEDADTTQWVLPEEMIETPIEASDEPDPYQPLWRIVLHRNESHGGSTRRWKQIGEYSDERFAEWQTNPPIDRVRRDFGPGYYRFDVKLGNNHLRIDAYPGIGGQRNFEVPDPDNPNGTRPPSPTVPTSSSQNSGHGSPFSLDINNLVNNVLGASLRKGAESGGSGLTVEQAAAILDASKTADAVSRKLESHLSSLDAKRDAEVVARESLNNRLGAIEKSVEKLSTQLDEINKRDPVAEAEKWQRQAKALGYEREGWVGVAERAVDAVIAKGGIGGGGMPTSAGVGAGGAPMQLPQNANPSAPSAPAGGGEGDWRTAEGGAWVNVGEWAEWVVGKIQRRQPTSTYLMADELVSRLLNDQRGAAWMKGATVEDLFQLFKWVAPSVDVSLLGELRNEAQTILNLFPTRYADAETMLSQLNAARGGQQAPPTVPVEPTTLPPREGAPPPPPPPPPGK